MVDKDTYWGFNNGLATLVTTLLQMNLQGYTLVLPDMIGGNGYVVKGCMRLYAQNAQYDTAVDVQHFTIMLSQYCCLMNVK